MNVCRLIDTFANTFDTKNFYWSIKSVTFKNAFKIMRFVVRNGVKQLLEYKDVSGGITIKHVRTTESLIITMWKVRCGVLLVKAYNAICT